MKWHKLVQLALVGALCLTGALVLPVIAQNNPPQDMVPGSFGVAPIFILTATPTPSATSIRITNTSGLMSVGLSLHVICPGTIDKASVACRDLDDVDVLTPHETVVYHLTRTGAPGPEGTVPLFAGCDQGFVAFFTQELDKNGDLVPATSPTVDNVLTGSYTVTNNVNGTPQQKYAGPTIMFQTEVCSAGPPATSPASCPPGTVVGALSSDAGIFDLPFGPNAGVNFVGLPTKLYGDFKAITADNDVQLVLLALDSIKGRLARVNIDFWDQFEHKKSNGEHTFSCWERVSLDGLNSDARFQATNLGSQYGSLRVTPLDGLGILGLLLETSGSPAVHHLFHTGETTAIFKVQSSLP